MARSTILPTRGFRRVRKWLNQTKRLFSSDKHCIKWFEQAMKQYERKDYTSAQGLLENVMKAERSREMCQGNTPVSLYLQSKLWQGWMYAENRQYVDAYEHLDNALGECEIATASKVLKQPNLGYQVGELAYLAGRYHQAITWLLKEPQNEDCRESLLKTRLLLGKAYYMSGQTQKVLETLILPEDAGASKGEQLLLNQFHAYRGCAFFIQDNWQLALVELQKVDQSPIDIFNLHANKDWTITKWRAHAAYHLTQYPFARQLFEDDVRESFKKIRENGRSSNDFKACLLESFAFLVRAVFKTEEPNEARRSCSTILARYGIAYHDDAFQSQVRTTYEETQREIEASLSSGSDNDAVELSHAPQSIEAIGIIPSDYMTALETRSILRLQESDTSAVPSRSTHILDVATHEADQASDRLVVGTPITPNSVAPIVLEPTSHADTLADLLRRVTDPGQELTTLIQNHNGNFSELCAVEVARLLKEAKAPDEHRYNPRLYIVLSRIESLDQLPLLLESGLTDYDIPLRKEAFKCLDGKGFTQSKVEEFLAVQDLVLTRDEHLEQGIIGFHHHFSEQIIATYPQSDRFKFLRNIYRSSNGNVKIIKVRSSKTNNELVAKLYRRYDWRTNKKPAELISVVTEIEVLKSVSDPHIVQFVGSFTDPKYFVLLIEPVADTDLEEYLQEAHDSKQRTEYESSRKTWKTSKEELRTFIGCMMRSLRDLHGEEIRHKDIKLSNLLTHKGRVLWSDFGLARRYINEESCVTTGPPSGFTTEFAAPEVLDNKPRDKSSDMFSFGLVLLHIAVSLKDQTPSWLWETLGTCGNGKKEPGRNVPGLHQCIEKLKELEPEEDNIILNWAYAVLQENPGARATSRALFDTVMYWGGSEDTKRGGNYCGDCCRGGSTSIGSH